MEGESRIDRAETGLESIWNAETKLSATPQPKQVENVSYGLLMRFLFSSAEKQTGAKSAIRPMR
jgi:hypothetical protein